MQRKKIAMSKLQDMVGIIEANFIEFCSSYVASTKNDGIVVERGSGGRREAKMEYDITVHGNKA